jgi:hypothetical protein
LPAAAPAEKLSVALATHTAIRVAAGTARRMFNDMVSPGNSGSPLYIFATRVEATAANACQCCCSRAKFSDGAPYRCVCIVVETRTKGLAGFPDTLEKIVSDVLEERTPPTGIAATPFDLCPSRRITSARTE